MQSWFLIKNIFSANILMRGFELSADILNKFLEIDYILVLVCYRWWGKINFCPDIGFIFAMESEKLSFFIRNFYKWFITTLGTFKSLKFVKLHHFKEAFSILSKILITHFESYSLHYKSLPNCSHFNKKNSLSIKFTRWKIVFNLAQNFPVIKKILFKQN